jgi:ATP-dependent DNA helicase RecQ
VIAGFDRPNLDLAVRRFDRDEDKRAAVVERVNGERLPGLVYVATRRDAERYAEALAERGLTAAAYHAGLRAAERGRTHQRFTGDELDVVVATSAFGMGIDKPNVRFVLHAAIPDSLDSYYQEIGRAGRDGEPANAVLLYRPEDLGLQRFHAGGAPDDQVLGQVARSLRRQRGPVGADRLRERLGLSATRLTAMVNLLEQAGAVVTGTDRRPRRTDLPAQQAVAAATEIAEQRRESVRSRIEMMRGYAETTDCRRRLLLGYFGEQVVDPCGYCDNCEAGTARAAEPGADEAAAEEGLDSRTRVRHPEWGDGVVMSTEPDRITVLFAEHGYKTLALDAVREHHLLEPADR